jgi:TAP-like protein
VPGPGGTHQALTITASVLVGWVDTYLSSIQTAVLLPAALHALVRGQWSHVMAEFGLTTASLISGPVSLQDVTIRCGDAWAIMNPATISQQGPSVFAAMDIIKAKGWRALCAVWPHDPGVSGIVRSSVPVVFLNGTADEGDPPASVAGSTATMPNALLVSVPGIAHWTLGWNPHPECLLAATIAFIQADKRANPAAWSACTRPSRRAHAIPSEVTTAGFLVHLRVHCCAHLTSPVYRHLQAGLFTRARRQQGYSLPPGHPRA